jgi:hypothetical protein
MRFKSCEVDCDRFGTAYLTTVQPGVLVAVVSEEYLGVLWNTSPDIAKDYYGETTAGLQFLRDDGATVVIANICPCPLDLGDARRRRYELVRLLTGLLSEVGVGLEITRHRLPMDLLRTLYESGRNSGATCAAPGGSAAGAEGAEQYARS